MLIFHIIDVNAVYLGFLSILNYIFTEKNIGSWLPKKGKI